MTPPKQTRKFGLAALVAELIADDAQALPPIISKQNHEM